MTLLPCTATCLPAAGSEEVRWMLRDERLQKMVAEVDAAPDRERVRGGWMAAGWVADSAIGHWQGHCHALHCRALPADVSHAGTG
jgi:hypothetical protein